jgi:hypothetical protein
LQIAMCFHQQADYQHHSIYLKSYISKSNDLMNDKTI